MLYKDKNYKHKLPGCDSGDIFEKCNLSQIQNREIATGKTGLTFKDCNLTNCIIPADSIIENCNVSKIDFCYWIHPEWSLPIEIESCRHVVSANIIGTDAGTMTEYIREDTHGTNG